MSATPKRYVIFDTESNEDRLPGKWPVQVLTLRLGVALVVDATGPGKPRETRCEFRTDAEFHDMLASLPFTTEPIYVIAHTIGFDVRMVNWMWWMGQDRYTLTHPRLHGERAASARTTYITDSPPFIVVVYGVNGQKFVLLDSVQWLSASLAKVGRWIDEPKGVMPAPDAPDDDWFVYCHQDVRVLHLAMKSLWSWLDMHRVPHWAYTPAGQSMQLFLGRQGKGKVRRPEDTSILALDRHGYYGGLMEAFHVGEIAGPLHQVDVSSLYPAVMCERGYPCEVLASGDSSGEPGVPDDFRPWDLTAEVWLDTPVHPFPVRGSDHTLWCTGRVRTILCGPELGRAYSLGVIRRVGRWVRYRLDEPFDDWVASWWAERLRARAAGNGVVESACKAILNSLHGKFGQRDFTWTDTGIRWEKGMYMRGSKCTDDPDRPLYFRIVDGVEFRGEQDHEDPRGFVPLAAWTASYARCHMWDMIHTAGLDHTYHIATDSLIVDDVGLARLAEMGEVADGVLGKFRVESTEARCHVHGPNAVDWGPKKKRPGIKSDAIEIAPDLWCMQKWSGFDEDTCLGRHNSVSIEAWFIRSSMSYSRREVLGDGSTRAWSIDNWASTPEEQSRMPVRG